MSIATILELAEERFPERIAVTAGARSLAYAHLLSAARAAGALVRRGGWRHLALQDATTPAAPIALFGAACAGVPFVPLDERLEAGELRALLAPLAPVRLIAAAGSGASALRGIPGIDVLGREDFLAEVRRLREAPEDPAEAAATAVLLPPGSAAGALARPMIFTHGELLAHVLTIVELGCAPEGDAALIALPPCAPASAVATLRSIHAGRRMVLLPVFDPGSWLEHCRREGASEAWLTSAMLARIVGHCEASGRRAALPALRTIVCGEQETPPSLLERAAQVLPGIAVTQAPLPVSL